VFFLPRLHFGDFQLSKATKGTKNALVGCPPFCLMPPDKATNATAIPSPPQEEASGICPQQGYPLCEDGVEKDGAIARSSFSAGKQIVGLRGQ